MSCAMIYWGNKYDEFYDEFIKFGVVIDLSHLQNERIGKERLMMKLKLG